MTRKYTLAVLAAAACSGSGSGDATSFASSDTATGTGTASATGTTSAATETATASASGTSSTGSSSTTGTKYDVGGGTSGTAGSTGNVDVCKVSDDMDAVGKCDMKAPPDSFEPEVQWSWDGDGTESHSGVAPLVANMTDDNNDGQIDLCDTPDVILVSGQPGDPGHVRILDGATGTQHVKIETDVSWAGTPAVGDIDGDLVPEIIALTPQGGVMAFEADGTIAWGPTGTAPYGSAIALADVDNDGQPEILVANLLINHDGTIQQTFPATGIYNASTAADLDGDMDLEIIMGERAYQHDGTELWNVAGIGRGFPQVGDLDMDGLPEVLVTTENGITIIEHDGTPKAGAQNLTPTGDSGDEFTWRRPATIHDFDGDQLPEFATSSAATYAVYEPSPVSIVWQAVIGDSSGLAAGTAFDFLGDGVADAMYADETFLYVYDGSGTPLFSTPRQSGTMIEYPTVADVDNDGSAEILVVSYFDGPHPALQVIRDKEDRWIQARRIWNQHTYHVTNVREDGTIPQYEPPNWKTLNTFRTQAQIEGGSVCKPEPEG